MSVPHRQIRARHDAETVTVYQAYGPQIAGPALAAGRFVAPFKRERMTWIKPSFLWMMYRCGWAGKRGQERVLAVDISRSGFEWALSHSCLSHYDSGHHGSRDDWARQVKTSPVRIQWDPERSLGLAPLPHRSLQVGLSGEAVRRYVDEWTVAITDVTPLAHEIRGLILGGDTTAATALLPREEPYPVPSDLAATIGISEGGGR